ncbi:MAG: inner-rane translocator [Actinomycetia bacterium]|nr:inner-rane translocator [Actinomycetes bacterium]
MSAEPVASDAIWRRVGRVNVRDYGIVFAFVAMFVALSFLSSNFFTQNNFANILDQWAALGLLAIGETICIIAGVFDLSTGAMVSVTGVVACKVALSTSPWLGLLAGVLTGLGLGIANGIVIHLTRINSFIGTLATSIVYAGIAILVTGGNIVTVNDASFGAIGQNMGAGIKYTGWTFIAFTILAALLLSRTTFGRYVYAVGGNAEASRLSGIRVDLIRGACFALSGTAAGLAGMLLASRTQSAQANLGAGMELTAISAAVVGGTSILGGDGAVWRGFLGIMLLAIIGNGFNLLNINTTYQQIVYGGLILIAVAADQLLRRRA